MRVIAGSAKGHRLAMPPNSATRPLLEMARGALFNKLGPRLAGCRVLDCYAGSGAIGIEALSRGAAEACFIECDGPTVQVLNENLKHCRLHAQATIYAQPVATALQSLTEEYDYIFLDPPFIDARTWQEDSEAQTVANLSASLLALKGTLVFRLEKNVKDVPESWGSLILQDSRTYGRSRICFYQHPDAEPLA